MNVGPGTRLGSFEILAPLGTGGMGDVYRARDLKLGRLVALKVLHAELASHPDRLRRFAQEARSASALSHPNIVTIFDIDTAGEAPYIAMELVEGRTLRACLGDGPLPFGRLRELALQAAEGLARAHDAGIVHRDLKPENLMVDPDGRLRILDFGLAKLTTEDLEGVRTSRLATLAAHGTRPGVLLGTVEYMSPEQAAARPVDFRSDQFSLGVILYEMATGRMAFRRETAVQTMASILESEPEPLPGGLPEAFRTLVERLLRKNPAERFADTHEVARLLAGLPSAASGPPPLPPPLPAASPPVPGSPTGASGSYRVQKDGKVRVYEEGRLRRKIRRAQLSGFELALPPGETGWSPLYETAIYRQEVPHHGDPQMAAHWRRLRGFGGHLLGFGVACTVLLSTAGAFPPGFLIWSIFVALHGLRVLPSAVAVLGGGPFAAVGERIETRVGEKLAVRRQRHERWRRALFGRPPAAKPEKPQHASPSFLEEVARVRELVSRRREPGGDRFLTEIDRLVASVEEMGARIADLTEQTGPKVRQKLATAEREVRVRLDGVTRPADREIFARQLELLERRQSSVDDARRLLDQLAVRRAMAEQQIQQLRLDLSRAEALSSEPLALSSRLEEIRLEVEAAGVVRDDLAAPTPEADWALRQALPEAPASVPPMLRPGLPQTDREG